MVFGRIRDVVRAVFGRIVVFIGIYAEEGKVTRVAGPDPVVRVASEFADGRGRSSYEPYVPEDLVEIQEILVAVVRGVDCNGVEVFVKPFECLSVSF